MATGAKWTSKIQMGWESTRGTAVTATRLAAEIIGGWFTPHVEQVVRTSQRGSLTNTVDAPIKAKEFYSIDGAQIRPSYATLPSYLEAAVKGTAYASNISSTAYSRVYQPTGTTDDLKTATFEVGLDTQAYSLPHGLLDKFTLAFKPDAPIEMTADWLFAQQTTTTFTSTPNPPTYGNEIGSGQNGRFEAWIDSSTIGTTTVKCLEAQFAYQNNWQQVWVSTGSNWPSVAERKPYTAELSMTLVFDATTEYDAFRANTLRKARIRVSGGTITDSSPSLRESVTLDWYGYWTDAPVVEQDGLYVVKTKGSYVADPTTRVPFAITVVNDQKTIL